MGILGQPGPSVAPPPWAEMRMNGIAIRKARSRGWPAVRAAGCGRHKNKQPWSLQVPAFLSTPRQLSPGPRALLQTPPSCHTLVPAVLEVLGGPVLRAWTTWDSQPTESRSGRKQYNFIFQPHPISPPVPTPPPLTAHCGPVQGNSVQTGDFSLPLPAESQPVPTVVMVFLPQRWPLGRPGGR